MDWKEFLSPATINTGWPKGFVTRNLYDDGSEKARYPLIASLAKGVE